MNWHENLIPLKTWLPGWDLNLSYFMLLRWRPPGKTIQIWGPSDLWLYTPHSWAPTVAFAQAGIAPLWGMEKIQDQKFFSQRLVKIFPQQEKQGSFPRKAERTDSQQLVLKPTIRATLHFDGYYAPTAIAWDSSKNIEQSDKCVALNTCRFALYFPL